ncbi:MAG: hypothetical protein NTV70_09860 [Acidobacteria bacterium]|nr:hypothetical protein [Acidobacteriota bacterium]
MISALVRLFSPRCPFCRSIVIRRVGVRNGFEQALFWLLQPYRCELCGHHFFLVRWQAPAESTA